MLAVMTLGVVDYASAHHSFAMFNRDKEEVRMGEVVRWAYNSPHVALYVRDADGEIWAFEGAAPAAILQRSPSMTGFTFQPGDQVMVVNCPLRDGRNGGALGTVLKDGEWYQPNDGGCGANNSYWRDWYEKGYMSKEEALAAGEEMPD